MEKLKVSIYRACSLTHISLKAFYGVPLFNAAAALFVMRCGRRVSISAAAKSKERAEWCPYPTCLLPSPRSEAYPQRAISEIWFLLVAQLRRTLVHMNNAILEKRKKKSGHEQKMGIEPC